MNKETNITKRDQAGALATNVFEADADAGSENMAQDDLALPFLKVLGQLSPEVNKRDAKFTKRYPNKRGIHKTKEKRIRFYFRRNYTYNVI